MEKRDWFELSGDEAVGRMKDIKGRLSYIYDQVNNDGKGYGQPYIAEVSSLVIELQQLNKKFLEDSLKSDVDVDQVERRLKVGYYVNSQSNRAHYGASRRVPHRPKRSGVKRKV